MNKRKGQSLIELAISVVVLFLVVSFMIDVFDRVHSNIVVLASVRDGAKWGARQPMADDILPWTLWKTCNSLEVRNYTPPGFSCPDISAISSSHPQISGDGIQIIAGWMDQQYTTTNTAFQFPHGEPVRTGVNLIVPVWVAVELERPFPVGFVSLGSKTYTVVQQAVMMTDSRY